MLPVLALVYFTVSRDVIYADFVTEDTFLELKKFVKLQQIRIDELERIVKLEIKTKTEDEKDSSEEEIDYGNKTYAAETDDRRSNKRRRDIQTHLVKRSVSQVAFHVYIGNGNACFHHHEIVLFDTEVTDIGNGFDNSDGIYEPPVSGVYVFVWTVVAPHVEYSVAELIVNGRVRGTTMTDAHVNGFSGTHPATGVAVLRVNTGDNIYVRRGETYGCSIAGPAYAMNTFSGWLLF